MKRLLPVVLLWIIPLCLTAQVDVSLTVGVGTFEMSDMKDLQESAKVSFPVEDAQINESFPPYLIFQIACRLMLKSNTILGGTLGYGSTGGRVSYGDYSGVITIDQLLTYYSLNATVGTSWTSGSQSLVICFDMKPGILLTRLKITEHDRIQSDEYAESVRFRAYNLNMEPTLSLTRKIGRYAILTFAAYHLDIVYGKLKLTENKNSYLVNSKNGPLRAEWNGLRVGVGISYFLR